MWWVCALNGPDRAKAFAGHLPPTRNGRGDHRTNRDNNQGVAGDLTLDQNETVVGLGGSRTGGLEPGCRRGQRGPEAGPDLVQRRRQLRGGRRPPTTRAIAPSRHCPPPLGCAGPPPIAGPCSGRSAASLRPRPPPNWSTAPMAAGGFNPDLKPRRGWNGEVGCSFLSVRDCRVGRLRRDGGIRHSDSGRAGPL